MRPVREKHIRGGGGGGHLVAQRRPSLKRVAAEAHRIAVATEAAVARQHQPALRADTATFNMRCEHVVIPELLEARRTAAKQIVDGLVSPPKINFVIVEKHVERRLRPRAFAKVAHDGQTEIGPGRSIDGGSERGVVLLALIDAPLWVQIQTDFQRMLQRVVAAVQRAHELARLRKELRVPRNTTAAVAQRIVVVERMPIVVEHHVLERQRVLGEAA
mmetsp:Transcript_16638/g.40962  ORF Transcript_16638/g.40962 Transcript_16638/m.40962 type:complete len:217 (+) Transcript_16638:1141-1791(+)